jgi:hypothetical protein
MSTKKNITGAALALTAASLFALAPATTMANEEAKVHCFGVNSCKGKGSCKSSHNSCKGQNTCKGKGWEPETAKQCEEKGGKVIKE